MLSRALPEAPAVGTSAPATAGAAVHSTGGGGGASAGGHSSDLIYTEMLRRVREEQEQLGRLINHPF
jgi:hypothetical protein